MTYRNANSRRTRSYRRSGQAFFPQQLGLLGYYDVHAGGSATQITDSSGNGLDATANGASAAAALYLPYTEPRVYTPGAVSNSISAADAAALDVTQLEMVLRLAASDWTPSAISCMFSKDDITANTWRGDLLTTGVPRFTKRGVADYGATQALAPSNGSAIWYRNTYTSASGAIDFYSAADATSEPSSWTQLGTSVSSPSGLLGTNATALRLGLSGANLLPFTGWFYRAILRDAPSAGATVANFSASDCTQSGYTDPAGAVWTVARAASGSKTVVQSLAANSARSIWQFATDDYATAPAAAIPAMGASDPWSIVLVIRQHDTPTNFGRYLSTKLSTGLGKGIAIRSNGTTRQIACHFGDGTNAVDSFGPAASASGVLQVVVVSCTGPLVTIYVNGVPGTPVDVSSIGDRATGQMELGRDAGSGSSYQDFELIAFGTASRALAAADALRLSSYFGGGS